MIQPKTDDDPTPIRVVLNVPTQFQDGQISLAYNDGRAMRMIVTSMDKETRGMAFLDITPEQVVEFRDALTALILYSESQKE